MASSSTVKTLDEQLREKFQKTPTPILTTLSEIDFSDAAVKKIPTYNMESVRLSSEEWIAASLKLEEHIKDEFKDSRAVPLLLLLAANLRDPEDPKKMILKPCKTVHSDVFSKSELGLELEEELPVPTREQMLADKPAAKTDHLKTEAEKVEAIKTSEDAWIEFKMNEYTIEKNRRTNQIPAGKGKFDVQYASFLAAYLLKSYIKTADNVLAGESNMKARCLGFYGSVTPTDTGISLAALKNLQERMKPHKKVLHTWIIMIAEFEEEADPVNDTTGIIRFLACMQFAYTGMQGYSLFREVLIVTGWSTCDALVNLHTAPSARALECINKIVNDFESVRTIEGTILNRTKYFKYARALNPQFFLPLQPSQCAVLICLCAELLVHYSTQGETADPMKIAVLSKLGKEQREYIKCMCETLVGRTMDDPTKKTTVETEAAKLYHEKKNKKAAQEDAAATDQRMKDIVMQRRKEAEEAARIAAHMAGAV